MTLKSKQYVIDCPELLEQWDFDKNKEICSPLDLAVGNNRTKVFWICRTCGKSFLSTAHGRKIAKHGCNDCANKAISKSNILRKLNKEKSLVFLFPDIASEWHSTKNPDMNLEEIMPGSNYKAWWICSFCKNEFQQMVYNRTSYKHAGCPICNKHMHTSFPEQAFYYYLKKVFVNTENRMILERSGSEIDILIPELRIGIEYDGTYWHQANTIEKSKKEYSNCTDAGIYLVRVKENYNKYEICEGDCDYSIYRTDKTDNGLTQAIIELFSKVLMTEPPLIDIENDRNIIKTSYITSLKDKSLYYKYPDLCKEWHPSLNKPLEPFMIMPGSKTKVVWLCPKCNQVYKASPEKRTAIPPRGCPVCAGKRIIPGINDLASRYPKIAAEWHPTLNGNLKPNEIAPNYNVHKVWWICRECNQPYEATPNKRVTRNQGCNKCRGKRIARKLHENAIRQGENSIASKRPDLLEEWDYEANKGVFPNEVTTGAKTRYHWICSVCGNKWEASPYSRIKLNSGCKLCADRRTGDKLRARRVTDTYNLAYQYPEIAAEWDMDNNDGRTPESFTPKASYKANWVCRNNPNHRWPAYIYNRTQKGSGCPFCSGRLKSP